MPNMTKQYREELRAMKKKAAALAREEKQITANATRGLKSNERWLHRTLKDAGRFAADAAKKIDREFRIEKKRIVSETTEIGTRIGILEGRLSK
jgi:hypothetical protein